MPLFPVAEKVAAQQDLVLLLIKKELQGRKFIQELGRLGFDSMLFSTELEDVILSFMGFTRKRRSVLA